MKRLILFWLLLLNISLIPQQDRFIVGVDWFNSTYPHPNETFTPLSDNYWNLAQSFGVNYVALNIGEGITNGVTLINNELTKAAERDIKVFLNTYKINYYKPRRWQYQAEADYDYLSHSTGDSLRDNAAEPHWSKVNVDPQAKNFIRLLTSAHSAGYAMQNIKSGSLPADGSTYYLKIRMKVAGTLDHTQVVRVVVSKGAVSKERIIYADEFTNTNWKEISVLSFDKTALGPDVATGITNKVINDSRDIAGVEDYTIQAPVINTDYDIAVYWYDQRDCDIDYIALDDDVSNNLFTGTQDNVISTTVNNFQNHAGLGNIKVWDEPQPENLLPVRYASEKVQELLSTDNAEKHALCFDMAAFQNAQQFMAKTRMKAHLADIYPIFDDFPIPSASYITSFQNIMQNGLIYFFQDQVAASKRFNVPYWFTPQAHSWSNGSREPSAYEIKTMVNLGIAYGVRGIHYFMFSIPVDHLTGNTFGIGLLDDDDPANPVPRYTDAYGYEKWNILSALNQTLNGIGDELLSLTWQNSYSIHLGQPSGKYITNISTGEAGSSTYVELGLFKKTTQLTDPNLEYFYIVNRRTLAADTRNISVIFSKSSTYSNWLVTEIGTTNKWVVAYNGSFQASYAPGEGKLFRFEPLFEGTSETLSGNVAVNTTITIPETKTLTISPGATITYNYRLPVTVYGTLSAVGTAASRITFTGPTKGSWLGIDFSTNQSNGSLMYCNIRNADCGIHINNTSSTIENCYIDDADTYGIYITGSLSNPLISSNYIEADSICIVHYYGSIGRITGNSFRNAMYGVYVNDGYPRYDYYSYGRNVFESSISQDKVKIASGQPWFGKYQYFYAPSSTTYNYIRNNSSSPVDAQYNYWAGGNLQIYFLGSGTVERSNALSQPPSNPSAGPGWTLTKSSTTDFYACFENASILFYEEKYSEARDLFRDLTDNNLDSAYSSYSLNWYMLSSEQLGDSESQSEYLNSVKQNKTAHELTRFYAVKWLMKHDLKKGSAKNARSFISAIMQGTKYDRELSLDLAQGLFEYLGDKSGAEELLDKLSKRFTDKDTDEDIYFIRKHMNSFSPSLLKNSSGSAESKTTEVPVSMNMFDAYPNPFNPTTTIAFSIIEAAKVNITIYDILGSEVTTLVDDIKERGYYTTSFNASNLASGLYFARITINAQNQQPFIKTIKMMLTK